MKTRESGMYTPILEYLRLRGVRAWRNNTGAVEREYKGKKRFIRFGYPGMSDIVGILPGGRFLAIEVKREGEKPTPKQQVFLAMVNGAGGLGFVAHEVSDVIFVLEKMFRAV
ncbi:MAG TPA: VRR-NUC domain-containing protein [Porphyromonadaceae bacterium]|nr:VRR-NUC domain-containing protein [Porphyromonadaceae bacterium]